MSCGICQINTDLPISKNNQNIDVLRKAPYLPFREEIGALHLKNFLKVTSFAKFSLFLTVSELRSIDFMVAHRNNNIFMQKPYIPLSILIKRYCSPLHMF